MSRPTLTFGASNWSTPVYVPIGSTKDYIATPPALAGGRCLVLRVRILRLKSLYPPPFHPLLNPPPPVQALVVGIPVDVAFYGANSSVNASVLLEGSKAGLTVFGLRDGPKVLHQSPRRSTRRRRWSSSSRSQRSPQRRSQSPSRWPQQTRAPQQPRCQR